MKITVWNVTYKKWEDNEENDENAIGISENCEETFFKESVAVNRMVELIEESDITEVSYYTTEEDSEDYESRDDSID